MRTRANDALKKADTLQQEMEEVCALLSFTITAPLSIHAIKRPLLEIHVLLMGDVYTDGSSRYEREEGR